MTEVVIPSLVPAAAHAGTAAAPAGRRAEDMARHAPLPLPDLAAQPRQRSTVYGLGAVDHRGRISDRAVIRAMGWHPHDRLDVRLRRGLALVTADPAGAHAVTRNGHLQLAALVRQECGVRTGERVLLAAEPGAAVLIVHPVSALDAMLTRLHEAALGGDRR